MNVFWQTVLKRFIRAFLAGFVASAVLVVPANITDYGDIGSWITALSVAGIVGGITGLLQALDKASRFKE